MLRIASYIKFKLKFSFSVVLEFSSKAVVFHGGKHVIRLRLCWSVKSVFLLCSKSWYISYIHIIILYFEFFTLNLILGFISSPWIVCFVSFFQWVRRNRVLRFFANWWQHYFRINQLTTKTVKMKLAIGRNGLSKPFHKNYLLFIVISLLFLCVVECKNVTKVRFFY